MNGRKTRFIATLCLAALPLAASADFAIVSRQSQLRFDGTNFGDNDELASSTSLADPFDAVFSNTISEVLPGGGTNSGDYAMSQYDVVSASLLQTVHDSSCEITTAQASPSMRLTGDFNVEFTVAADTVVVFDGFLSGSSNIAQDPFTAAVLDISSLIGTPDVFNSAFDDFPLITTLSPGQTYRLTVDARATCDPDPLTNSAMLEVSLAIVPDSDDDGVLDTEDNCIAVPNPDQRDTNGDGFGNLCDADLNDDCQVNFSDVGQMKSVFFSDDADADLNEDDAVNFADLGLLKNAFFMPPGPSGVPNACD